MRFYIRIEDDLYPKTQISHNCKRVRKTIKAFLKQKSYYDLECIALMDLESNLFAILKKEMGEVVKKVKNSA